MNFLNNLKRQHDDLDEIIGEIRQRLRERNPFLDRHFLKDLSFMEGKMKIHLTMEDRHLYPRLLKLEKKEIDRAAEEYQRDMMHLFDAFHSCMLRLKKADDDSGENERLAEDLSRTLGKISERIAFEESSLFPLLEEAGIS